MSDLGPLKASCSWLLLQPLKREKLLQRMVFSSLSQLQWEDMPLCPCCSWRGAQCSECIEALGFYFWFIAQSAILLWVKAVVEFNIITLTGPIAATKTLKLFHQADHSQQSSFSLEGSQGHQAHTGNFCHHMQPQHLPFIFCLLHCWGEGTVLRTRLVHEVLIPSLIPQLNNSGSSVLLWSPRARKNCSLAAPLLHPDSLGCVLQGPRGKAPLNAYSLLYSVFSFICGLLWSRDLLSSSLIGSQYSDTWALYSCNNNKLINPLFYVCYST